MIDAFDRLEQFFSGTLSLLYNTIISLAMLLRDPVRGSLRLTARYRVSTSRQIGPSTLTFIIFLLISLVDAFTITSRPYALNEFEEAINSQSVVAFFSKSLVVAFVGASLVDLFSRVLYALMARKASLSVRRALFPRFQYAISFGLLCQVAALVIPMAIGFPRLLAIVCCIIFPAAGFWPSYRVVTKLSNKAARWQVPVALMVLMSAAWVAFIEIEDTLGMADIGVAVAQSDCDVISSTGPKCSVLIYNGSPDDVILDLRHVTATFHADNQAVALSAPNLTFPLYPDAYIVAEKGKGFTLAFTGSSSSWTTWFPPHQHGYFTVKVTIPYRLANTLSWTWFTMDEWVMDVKQPPR